MKVRYSRPVELQPKTECYGCDTMTSNESGMCDKCGSNSTPRIRKRYTLEEAMEIIKGQTPYEVLQEEGEGV